jgi:Kef-type K+ transport system membrane component KefB
MIAFDSVFHEIAALLLFAAAIGALALWLRQPLIVGYILVGILAGPSVLGRVLARTRTLYRPFSLLSDRESTD